MITFKKFGKTIKIRNDDWKELRKRFDSKSAKWSPLVGIYTIDGCCSLCDRHKSRHGQCGSCPFSEFDYDYGCMAFVNKLFESVKFDVGRISVSWSRRANKLAREQLSQIQKMMDKIEASQ